MPIFFNDAVDDPLVLDSCPSYSGGQVSFQRANLLQPNQAALLENVSILINGELRKRRGSRSLGIGFLGAEGEPVQGILYFDTATDAKTVAFCGGQAFWYDSGIWVFYFDAEITDHAEIIDCVQLTDRIYWTDSNEPGISVWNGTTAETVSDSPPARNLTVHGTRLVASGVSGVPDALDFSDLLDGETWDLTNQRLRIGIGDGDPIIGHISWQETGVLVFKRQSTWLVDANPLTDVAAFSIKSVHGTIGCVAKKTIAQVGQDVWFLSRSGVQSVQKQLATSNNQITVPVSQPIQDIIGQIRWEYAHKSCAKFYNNQYILSVPIDSNEPDTVLCYNTLTGGWVIFRGWEACFFLEQPFNGNTRLLYGRNTGEIREWLDYLPDSSEADYYYAEGLGSLELPFDLDTEIPPSLDFTARAKTRALTFGEPINPKSGFYGEVEYVLSDVNFSIWAVLDGRAKIKVADISNQISQTYLPTTLPFTLPGDDGWARERFPLHHLAQFRELQFEIECPEGKLVLRDITASAFVDTLELRQN